MSRPNIRQVRNSILICLGSSYVWSERWSEKPEVCWFDSDLRHQSGGCRFEGSVQYLNSVFLVIRKYEQIKRTTCVKVEVRSGVGYLIVNAHNLNLRLCLGKSGA